MVSSNAVVLCTYSYDPLDRLAAASPAGSDSVQRFYQKSRLTTEIQGEIQRAVFQSEDYLLARQQLQSGQTDCALLGTDQQRSVLHGLNPTQQQAFAYAPYGFRPPQLDLPGFNGEQPDPLTGHYLLGNGYRAFNPVLMRFNSPDSLSPFGDGGLNAYAYCGGDPVNRSDPTGHTLMWVKEILRAFNVMQKTPLASPLINSSPTGSFLTIASSASKSAALPKSANSSPPPKLLEKLPPLENVPRDQLTKQWVQDLPPQERLDTHPMALIYEDRIPVVISSQRNQKASKIIIRGKKIAETLRVAHLPPLPLTIVLTKRR